MFRPGAPSSGIYVATWAEVEIAVTAAQSDISVLVDSSLAPATVPAATDLDGRDLLTLGPAAYRTANYAEATLAFEDGARIRNVRGLEGPILVTGAPTVRSMFSWDPFSWFRLLLLRDGAQIAALPGATLSPVSVSNPPFIFAPFQAVFDYGARYNDSGLGIPCVSIGSGSSMILIVTNCFDPSAFTPNLVGGDATTTLLYIGDASAPRPSPTFLWPTIPAAVVFSLRMDSMENITPSSGATVDRPSASAMTGQMYFDTDLGIPAWWTGTQWVNASGVAV